MVKISVIIAVYNVEPYLKKCLESVLTQSYDNLEIIAVNDGSTDSSLSILHAYKEKDSRLVIVDKPNGGLSDARNAGMTIATGDYLCFLDGDDWYDRTFIEELYDAMVAGNNDLVCCSYRSIEEDGKTPEWNFLEQLPLTLNNHESISAFLTQKIIGSVAIKMFKHRICRENDLFFPREMVWEDLIFTFRYLLFCRKTGIVHKCLYNYFQREASISRSTDSLNVLHWMQSALYCVKLNEERNPGLFTQENSCLLTYAFIGLLVHSFKSKDKSIQGVLRQEIKKYDSLVSITLIPLPKKLLILLYRINYSLTKWVFIHIYKRIH